MLYALGFHSPVSASGEYFVAPSAAVIGRVHLGRDASVWFGAVLRGDTNEIEIGDSTNIQDNAVVHVDDDAPARLGDNVTVGHSAVVHGCTVGSGSLIGIGATILSHADIGAFCIVGAGALITERKQFPDRSLIIGAPAKRVREVTDEEVEMLKLSAAHYAALGQRYRGELKRL
ncbi:MAG TPA: gamma carbonic anhydrase family protein [Gammaproteobacteria bacterium]|nr:gamma carbonic anhydrase family protein [Gammaproteobacteria bacterium]